MGLDQIKQELKSQRLSRDSIEQKDYLSTGSTLLNLALTGTMDGGFLKGSYSLFVGDTDSGKTFICMTCLAEASINPEFDDYRFLFINKERGALMNIREFFGKGVEERLEVLDTVETVEEMYYVLDDALSQKQPFICIVDSIDSLSSDFEGKKFFERKTAFQKGKEARGDYGDGKAKIHSGNIRRILSGLEKTGSIVIFINQTRDNIDAGPFAQRWTHSGGRAISFYCCSKIKSSVSKKLKKTYRNKERQIGTLCKIQVIRSRVTGRQNTVEVPIYFNSGLDDVGSCIQYLISEGEVQKKGSKVTYEDVDFEGGEEGLIEYIEENSLETHVKLHVAEVWREIEEAVSVKRKNRYTGE